MTEITPTLALWRKLSRWPFGAWLFTRAACAKTPYFGSISPCIVALEANRCEATIEDRRKVRNHIGTVHAIALCNLAELCMGAMAEASIPAGMRWIPKSMSVQYLKKARGRMRGVATPAIPFAVSATGYELPIQVDVFDPAGERVFCAEIRLWLSAKPPVAAAATSS
jgi:acyl-coenzyme A thioesterase PaaI-like protein